MWNIFPRPLQSVCQRHAYAIPQRRAGSLRRRHRLHSHISPASTARQQLQVICISHRLRTVAESLEDRCQRLEEYHNAFRQGRCTNSEIPTISALRGEPIHWVDTARFLGVTLDT